jgi:hypothetical protein
MDIVEYPSVVIPAGRGEVNLRLRPMYEIRKKKTAEMNSSCTGNSLKRTDLVLSVTGGGLIGVGHELDPH